VITYPTLRRNRQDGGARDLTLIGFTVALMAGLASGAQALVLVNSLWQPPPAPTQATGLGLLPWAVELVVADGRDRLLYLAGILLTSVLGFASLWAYCRPAGFWSSKCGPAFARLARERHIPLLVPTAILAVQWAIVFLAPNLAPLVLSAALSVFLLLADLVGLGIAWALPRQPGPAAAFGAKLQHASENDQGDGLSRPAPSASGWRRLTGLASSGFGRAAGHAAALLATVLLLYVPDHRPLAGRFLEIDGFHHWDSFAVAPTHAYLQGLTPVLEFVSQYGLGIPVVLGSVFKITGNFGYAKSGTAQRRDGQVELALVWQAKTPVPRDYTVFAHVYNNQGQLVGQSDGWPANGNYPTSAWLPGEYVVEKRLIPLPPNLAPGAYTVKVGLYDAKTMERLVPSPDHGDSSFLAGRLEIE